MMQADYNEIEASAWRDTEPLYCSYALARFVFVSFLCGAPHRRTAAPTTEDPCFDDMENNSQVVSRGNTVTNREFGHLGTRPMVLCLVRVLSR